jgi:hypothetical protein
MCQILLTKRQKIRVIDLLLCFNGERREGGKGKKGIKKTKIGEMKTKKKSR